MDSYEDQEMSDGTLKEEVPTNPDDIEPKIEEVGDVDRELADWFDVDLKPPAPEDSETEAESDADSNNDDVKEEDLDDEWFRVPEVPRDSGTEPLDDNVRDLNRCSHTLFTDCLTVKYYSPFTIAGKDVFSFVCSPVTMASGRDNGGGPSKGI